ncbi:histone-binding protein N1/N2-like isoform X2 [Sander lucioperca]|uniref:histone-binding protein N1/N2-like isoform X2 n=1 Tax=Sander lucioperca TaxID=283035 RepID=UPI0016537A14|nr:histone-binding protein N1/N2-like isoform X2 [Sander lucioperca]
MEEANKLIGTGKKHLVMGKVVEAVSALQEACGMLAKKYGDTADECGEAFFWCGKALLDLARMENSVLGNALEGVPEDDEDKPKDSNVDSTENIDEKTRDELRVQVYDAMAEKKNEDKVEEKKAEDQEKKAEDQEKKAEDQEKKAEDQEKKGDVEKAEGCDEQQNSKKKDEEKNSEVNGSKSESKDKVENDMEAQKESGDKEEKTEDDDDEEEEEDCDVEMEVDAEEQGDGAAEKDSDDDEEEEVGNLQLAWEMLEVAKVIYKRKEAKEDQLMAAQTHLKLGEVSSESGNYTQALEDFQECLKLQVKHLDSDSRLLAETHYQLGLTYSLDLQYSQAIEELKSSISVIRSRLDKLQELLDKAEGPEALPDERKEMEELKTLLPEIQDKVEDATEGLKSALDGGSTSSAFPGSTVQNGDSSSSSKINSTSTNEVSSTNEQASTTPVSNISHLVRKKRKPEESPVKEGVKKVKQNDGQTNGVHKANGDTNGHTDSTEVKSQ